MKKKKSILRSVLHTERSSILIRAVIELLHGGLVIAAAWETAVIVNAVFMEHGGPTETASDLLMLFLCVLSMTLLRLPKSRRSSPIAFASLHALPCMRRCSCTGAPLRAR